MAKLEYMQEQVYNTHYSDLRGVDWSNPPTEVSRHHAIDILNMMPDEQSGIPVKRYGFTWKALTNGSHKSVVCAYHETENDFDIVITERDVLKLTGEGETIETLKHFDESIFKAGANVVALNDNIYICGGGDLFVISAPSYNEVVSYKSGNDAYVPTTIVGRHQDATFGSALEGVNIFSNQRVISFLSDDPPFVDGSSPPTNKVYRPYAETEITNLNNVILSIDKVEVMNSGGAFEVLSPSAYTILYSSDSYQFKYYDANKNVLSYSGRLVLGITLTTARTQVVYGHDDLKMTVTQINSSKSGDKDASGNDILYGMYSTMLETISKSSISALYGYNNIDRIFYACGNRIIYTSVNNPSYIPDDNYIVVGNENIVGLHRFNGYLMAITEDNDEFTVYQISGKTTTVSRVSFVNADTQQTTTEEIPYFAVFPTMAGIGAIARNSFSTLVNDPLFLTRDGIYGLNSTSVTSRTIVTPRSSNISPKLKLESVENLKNACSTVWNGMYVLSSGGYHIKEIETNGVKSAVKVAHIYLLNSKVMTNINGHSCYEAYYWEVPMYTDDDSITFLYSHGDELHICTDKGMFGTIKYSGDGMYNDEISGEFGIKRVSIPAYFNLMLDTDNYPQYYKTVQKKGTLIELDNNCGKVNVYAKRDGYDEILLKEIEKSEKSRFVYIKKKLKKYKAVQFRFENTVIDEDLRIVSFVKSYTVGNYAKQNR